MAALPIDDQGTPLYSVGQFANMRSVCNSHIYAVSTHAAQITLFRGASGQHRYSRREIDRV